MKTYTKIIAGISILASIFVFAYYVNAQNSNVSLSILQGSVTYNVSGLINLGSQSAGFAARSKDVVSGTFQTNSFVVQDLKGSGYTFQIKSSDLIAGGHSISSGNVHIKLSTALSETGDTTSNVTSDVTMGSWFSLSSDKNLLIKPDDGKINKAAVTPTIGIDIPANQAVGSYSGTLTITVAGTHTPGLTY